MGLNLDVDHVAFAATASSTATSHAPLTPGRARPDRRPRRPSHARRHLRRHGADADPFEQDSWSALESHDFEPVRHAAMAQPRRSISPRSTRCRRSLDATRRHARADPRPAWPTDQRRSNSWRATRPSRPGHQARAGVELLVGVLPAPRLPQDLRRPACRDHHAASSASSWRRTARCRPTGLPSRSRCANRTEGDIDTLSNRIAQIRTWTFVANRPQLA